MADPISGVAHTTFVQLVNAGNPSIFLPSPTIENNDFMVSKDGGALVAMTIIPTVVPPNSGLVQVSLTAEEMTAESVNVRGFDQSGQQWQSLIIVIDTQSTANADTIHDIMLGDTVETYQGMTIKKAGTEDVLLTKTITGSLLNQAVTIRTSTS